MKKFSGIWICLSGFIFFSMSCTKHLDLEPVSLISNESFWKTEEDVKGALYGMYHSVRADAVENLFLWGEARSDIWVNNYTADPNRIHIFENDLNLSKAGPTWANMYQVVHNANLLLKYVPSINFSSEENKKNILAQAHAMRAYLYFTMTKTWGDLILKTDPTEKFSSEEIYKGRSSQAEVFELIKKDIDDAIALFPTNSFATGRNMWSKSSVNTLKADVYLWTGKRLNGGASDFTHALNAASEAETADNTLLTDFNRVFAYDNKGNKEIVMAIRFHELESVQRNYFGLIHPLNAPNPKYTDAETIKKISPVGPEGNWQIAPTIAKQFNLDDQRRDATFVEVYETINGVTNWKYNTDQKWKGVIIGGVRGRYDDWYIYRFADILLLKAEAKNALGQDPSPEINKIRQRAYGDKYSAHIYVNGTIEQNNEVILQERLFEFTNEGKRWWDLIRFGKVFEKVPTLKNRIGQDYLYLFPIAESILSAEPFVQQNPGYGYSK